MQLDILKKGITLVKSNPRILFLCLCLVILLFISIVASSKDESPKPSEDIVLSSTEQFELNMEEKLKETLSLVDGVGDCTVAITLEKSECKIFAKDSYEDERENKYEYVILSNNDGSDDGMVVSVLSPEIRGVAVVCEGGDSAVIVSNITEMCMSLFNIEASRVSVSKMK